MHVDEKRKIKKLPCMCREVRMTYEFVAKIVTRGVPAAQSYIATMEYRLTLSVWPLLFWNHTLYQFQLRQIKICLTLSRSPLTGVPPVNLVFFWICQLSYGSQILYVRRSRPRSNSLSGTFFHACLLSATQAWVGGGAKNCFFEISQYEQQIFNSR